MEIKAKTTNNYKLYLNDIEYSFSDEILIENLNAGNYKFCISVPNNCYESCFNLEIKKALTISGKVAVKMNNKVIPTGFDDMVTLPRVGVKLGLVSGLENVEWYGKGPQENYPDRNESAHLGIYNSTATDLFTPYLVPQENGARSDARWLALAFKNNKKSALKIEADAPFVFSALHYDASDLDKASRPAFLKSRNETVLNLDAKILGLGNASCGPIPLKQYLLPVETYEFSFMFRVF